MMQVVTLFLLLYTDFLKFHGFLGAVQIRCDNQGYLEGPIYTYMFWDTDAAESNISWSFVTSTRQTLDLGFCDGLNNCRSLQSSKFWLLRSSLTYAYLRIYNMTRETAGTLVLTESYDGWTAQDTCTVRVTSVRLSCSDNGYEYREASNSTIYCDVSTLTRSITWSLIAPTGHTTSLGTCYGVNNCSSPLDPYIMALRTSTTQSYLTVTNITRETAGTLVCSDGFDSSTCTLDVYNTPLYGTCSLQVHRSNWTAVLTCEILKIQSALANVGFQLLQYWRDPFFVVSSRYLTARRLPFTLASYIDSTDRRLYYRGNYTYSWLLPMLDGFYYYIVYTYPGGASKSLNEGFVIESPQPPSHNCTQLKYLPESGPVPCVCSTPSVGRPAGRLVWSSGDTVLAAGQYGITELLFPDIVDRQTILKPLACRLDWVVRSHSNTSITIGVAYGPHNVSIDHGRMLGQVGDDYIILATCNVQGINPFSPDMARWGGLCQGQTGFTCRVTGVTPEDNGKDVTCTVTNAANKNNSKTASIRIRIDDDGTANPPTDQPYKTALSATAGALGVVVLVVAIVLVFMWKRNRIAGSNPRYPNTVRRPDDSGHTYYDLNLRETAAQVPNNASGPISILPAPGGYPEAVYENHNAAR